MIFIVFLFVFKFLLTYIIFASMFYFSFCHFYTNEIFHLKPFNTLSGFVDIIQAKYNILANEGAFFYALFVEIL